MAAAIVFIFTIAVTAHAFSAAPSIAWEKTFSNSSGSYRDVQVIATDDGYVMAGSYRDINDQCYIVLIKTDREGNVIWNRSYDGFYTVSSLVAAGDGYMVAGVTSKQIKTVPLWLLKAWDVYLAKFDRNGNMTWWKIYNWLTDDRYTSIAPVNDSYVLVGTYGTVTISMDLSAHMVEIDQHGNEIWNRTFGRSQVGKNINPDHYFYSILPADNGYIIAGRTGYGSWVNTSSWLMKTDRDGNEIWNHTYVRGYEEKIVNASDGYGLLVKTESGYHLIKTDYEGNEIWDRHLGNYKSLSIAAVPDGYVLSGDYYNYTDQASQISLTRTDTSGKMLWNATLDMPGINVNSRVVYDHGAYVIAGLNRANATEYNNSIFLLKTRPEDPAATASWHAASPTPAIEGFSTIVMVAVTLLIVSKYGKGRKEW